MSTYQWLGLALIVGWVGALLAYGFRKDAWLTRTMLLGMLIGALLVVPFIAGVALLVGDLP